jgi:hypothetical protein
LFKWVDPQFSLMFHPVGAAEIAITDAPAFLYALGATVDAAPLAQ